MIELIVVIGIIILAAGMMTPQITDFFKGRKLRQLANSFRSTINSARLKAVNERTQVRLVFFREGVRVFAEREGKFVDELFNPEASEFAGDAAWYVLGFYSDTPSVNLRKFREWEQEQSRSQTASKRRTGAGKAAEATATPSYRVRQLDGLAQIIYRRDGSVEFNVGSDVSSIFYKKDPPTHADLIIYVKNNSTACYIDLQLTGQNRSKLVVLEAEPEPPLDPNASSDDEGQDGRGKSRKRRSRRR